MSARRPLGETLTDVACGALDATAAVPMVRVLRLSVTLPMEFALSRSAGEWKLLADVPRTVTRTAFDVDPGRVEIVWTIGEAA